MLVLPAWAWVTLNRMHTGGIGQKHIPATVSIFPVRMFIVPAGSPHYWVPLCGRLLRCAFAWSLL